MIKELEDHKVLKQTCKDIINKSTIELKTKVTKRCGKYATLGLITEEYNCEQIIKTADIL